MNEFDDTQLQWIYEALVTLSEHPSMAQLKIADQHIQPIADKVREELEKRGWKLNGVAVYSVSQR